MKKSILRPSGQSFLHRHILLASFLFIGTFLLYSPTIRYDFTLDDPLLLKLNDQVRDFKGNYLPFFTSSLYEGSSMANENKDLYRPLLKSSLALNYQIAGGVFDSKSFHIGNVILYGFCVVIFFYFLINLFPKQKIGSYTFHFFGAILFAAFPSHLESVANIKHREEIMACMFGLLAWLAAIRGNQEQGNRFNCYYLFGGLSFFLAVLSKESAIMFFPCILIWNWISIEKSTTLFRRLPSYVYIYSSILAIYFVLRAIALDDGALGIGSTHTFFSTDDGLLTRLLLTSQIFWKYYFIDQLFVFKLNPSFSNYFFIFSNRPQLLISIAQLSLIFLFILLSLWFVFNKRSKYFFWILGFFIISFFISNIIPIGTVGAFRLMFTPSVFICILLLVSLSKLSMVISIRFKFSDLIRNRLFVSLVFILSLVYLGLTSSKMKTWQNNETIFSYSSKVDPMNPYSLYTIGQIHSEFGNTIEKFNSFDACLKLLQSRYSESDLYDERTLDFYSIVITEKAYQQYASDPYNAIDLSDRGIEIFKRLQVIRNGAFDSNIAGPYYVKALALMSLKRYSESLIVCKEGLKLTNHQGLSDLRNRLEMKSQSE